MSDYPLLSYFESNTGRMVEIHYHMGHTIGKLNIPQNSCLIIHPLLKGGEKTCSCEKCKEKKQILGKVL